MRRTGKILTAAAVTLSLTAAGAAGLYFGLANQVTVDGIRYRQGIQPLDLRDQNVSPEHYENLKQVFPHREILWYVPFQERSYLSTTEKITLTALSEEDVKSLRYLPRLSQVDASNCFDYGALELLRKELPQCQVESYVAVDGQILPREAEELSFSEGRGNFEELTEKLPYLPNLKKVSFREPEMTAQELRSLQQTYPEVEFLWTKKLFGKQLQSDIRELDLSGMKFSSVEEIERQTDYLPGLKKLTVCDTELLYEDLAAYRERSRGRFKVIFNVLIKSLDIRTDSLRFVPSELGVTVADSDTRYLKYCEDLIYVDLSGCIVRNIDWAWGTPHLRYLILKNSPLRDLQPLRNLKELKLLELRKLDLRDLRPLKDCTALEDLSITGVFPDVAVLGDMKWLKNLWTTGGRDELQALLPQTAVHPDYHGGWEDLKNYQDMKNLKDPHVPKITEPRKKWIVPGFVIPKA